MIKLIPIEMFDEVLYIYKSATRKMEEMTIHQWDEFYPSNEIIHNDIMSNTMFGYFIGGELCAVQVINNIQSPEYAQINWKYKDNNPTVLHRLCVDPMFQNKGISKQMILFAENFAVENKYRTIRFDAFIKNPISVNIYRKIGFTEAGIVTFRKGEFYCFEKKTIHYEQ